MILIHSFYEDMLGGSGNYRKRNEDDKERYTFEVSWEVCNKGGCKI